VPNSNQPLPTFKYHPDPVTTGSVVESPIVCKVCGEARGFIYTGPVYAIVELGDSICPWCIAEGRAHAKFKVEFTDSAGIGGYGDWDEVTETVIAEVAQRTPGFSGWQQEKWFTHCKDAALFLGRVGYAELKKFGPEVVTAFEDSASFEDDEEETDYLEDLDKDGSPSGYLFRCLHCGQYGGYVDRD
jgi:uncharacterized protein